MKEVCVHEGSEHDTVPLFVWPVILESDGSEDLQFG